MIRLEVTGRCADVYPGADIAWVDNRMEVVQIGHTERPTIEELIMTVCDKPLTNKEIQEAVTTLDKDYKSTSVRQDVMRLAKTGKLTKFKPDKSKEFLYLNPDANPVLLFDDEEADDMEV